jgi:transcriptional regulator with XRE-family HTH domain
VSRVHGTKACYVFGPDGGGDRTRGCRCEACRKANRSSENERNRQIAYGRWQPYTDAEPVREHLRVLAAAGMGWKRAAALSGVSTGAVSKLLYGGPGDRPPTRRVRPATAAAILAVRPALDTLAGGAETDATGTLRRVRALVARGWSQARIARQLGVGPANLGDMLYRRQAVTAATARAVRDLYARLEQQAPPEGTHREKIAASRARNYAAERGWPPPLAWDAIDDPRALPADGWRRDARLSAADLAAEARDLEGLGLDRDEIAKRLGVTRNRVGRALRPDAEESDAA